MRNTKSPKAVKASGCSLPASPFITSSDYILKNFLTAVEAQADYLYAITETADLDELQAAVYGFTGSIGPLLEAVKAMELNRAAGECRSSSV